VHELRQRHVPDEPDGALLHDARERHLLPVPSEVAPLPRARRHDVRLPEVEVKELLEGLRARHLAFVERRLVAPEAQAAWRDAVAAGVEAVLAAPLGDVAPADEIADALERLATKDAFDSLV